MASAPTGSTPITLVNGETGLDRERDTADEPASPDRDEDGIECGSVFDQLDPGRRGAEHHLEVVERMHERELPLL